MFSSDPSAEYPDTLSPVVIGLDRPLESVAVLLTGDSIAPAPPVVAGLDRLLSPAASDLRMLSIRRATSTRSLGALVSPNGVAFAPGSHRLYRALSHGQIPKPGAVRFFSVLVLLGGCLSSLEADFASTIACNFFSCAQKRTMAVRQCFARTVGVENRFQFYSLGGDLYATSGDILLPANLLWTMIKPVHPHLFFSQTFASPMSPLLWVVETATTAMY